MAAIPPVELADAARRLAYEIGVQPAAQKIGVGTHAYANLCGRLPMHRSSISLAAERLGVLI